MAERTKELQVNAERLSAANEELALRVEELKKSEKRFRDFADLGTDWFWEMDENLRFQYLSPNIAQLGTKIDYFIGNTLMCQFPGKHVNPCNTMARCSLLEVCRSWNPSNRRIFNDRRNHTHACQQGPTEKNQVPLPRVRESHRRRGRRGGNNGEVSVVSPLNQRSDASHAR